MCTTPGAIALLPAERNVNVLQVDLSPTPEATAQGSKEAEDTVCTLALQQGLPQMLGATLPSAVFIQEPAPRL